MPLRKTRADSLRYNRVLRGAVNGGDRWPLYHTLWRQDRADISRITDDRRAIEIADERQQRLVELIANPGYKTPPAAVPWPSCCALSIRS